MIYVFNKNKIISYVIATCLVLTLFSFRTDTIPNKDVELLKVSSNVLENDTILNNINNVNNNY